MIVPPKSSWGASQPASTGPSSKSAQKAWLAERQNRPASPASSGFASAPTSPTASLATSAVDASAEDPARYSQFFAENPAAIPIDEEHETELIRGPAKQLYR